MAEASIAPQESEADLPFAAPWPGSREMPRWNTGSLVDAPTFTWKNWFAMLGPGLLVGGSAIGGGEWLAGPAVTARYGGGLMWLATLSILGQVFYNMEISRYALYTGEPIFTGKFRTLPGPRFWLFMYLLLDFGAVFPYLAANAATPLAAVYLGRIPAGAEDESLVRGLGLFVFLLAMLPLIFGGKIYNTLKVVMSFKIVTVLGFLLFVAIFFSSAANVGRDRRRVFQVRHRAGPAGGRPQRQRRARPGRRLGRRRALGRGRRTPPAHDRHRWRRQARRLGRYRRRRQARQVPGPRQRRHSRRRQHGEYFCVTRTRPRVPDDRFQHDRAVGRVCRDRRLRRIVERADQQLHARPGLGHGAPRRAPSPA